MFLFFVFYALEQEVVNTFPQCKLITFNYPMVVKHLKQIPLTLVKHLHIPANNQTMTNARIIGKSLEITSLNQIIRKAANGSPQMTFISGPAGIGKSTLIQQINIPPGFRSIETLVSEEETPSYSIIANFLRQTTIFSNDRRKTINEFDEYAGYFLPEFRKPNLSKADFETLLHIFCRIVADLAQTGPLVWIIEDFHNADAASYDMVTGLYSSGIELPFVLIATYRDEQISRDHPLRRMRTKFRRHRWFSEIEPQPFTTEEITDFITVNYGSKPTKELASAILAQTGGLPLLVSEIMSTLQKKGLLLPDENGFLYLEMAENFPIPENIRDLVVLQMDGLSPGARDLAEILACYSMEFQISFLENFVETSPVIDELIDKGIILEKNPGTGTFRHALYRESIRSEIIWSKRRDIYRKIVYVLEKQRIAIPVLAEFYQKAGMKDKARKACIRSARESCDLLAYRDAARWAEQAMKDWPQGEEEMERLQTLEEFAHCSKVSGNLGNTIKALKEITESSLVTGNHKKLAETYRELAVVSGLQGAWSQHHHYRALAADFFENAGIIDQSALEHMNITELLMGELNLSLAENHIDKAVNLAREFGIRELLARALALNGYLRAYLGDTETGIQLARKAVEMALETNDLLATAEAYRRLAGTMEYASSFNESIDVYETAYRFCSANQLDYDEMQCLGCMAWVLMRLGDWKRSFDTCSNILGNKGSASNSKATANTVLSILRSYRGEIKTARKHLDLAGHYAAEIHSIIHKLLNKWPEALIAQGENDIDRAGHIYTEMLDIWFQTEDRHDAISGICDAASFFALQNNKKELNRAIEALTVISDLNSNPEAIGILSFAVGTSLSLNDEPEQAVNHYQKSIEYLEKANVPLQGAIVHYHLGMADSKLGNSEAAEESFNKSYQTFKRLGVRHWCSLIDEQRKQMVPGEMEGERHKTGKAHAYHLTGRQYEILKLLTEGLSNKEIAVKINLSARTIDMHVRNIFDRLNCRSRTEAVKIALNSDIIEAGKTH